MGLRNAIVVRRAQKLGGYRDGDGGESLVLEQIGSGPAQAARVSMSVLVSALGGGAAFVVAHSPIGIAIGLVVGAAVGVGLGAPLDRLRERMPVGRVVVGDRVLRVFRPQLGDLPVAKVAVNELARIELVPRELADPPRAWSLVAISASGESIELLSTRDRSAGLRARTLVLDRVVRDGAFEGEPIASTACPACRARIVALHRWLPTPIACAQCGVEGTFARAA